MERDIVKTGASGKRAIGLVLSLLLTSQAWAQTGPNPDAAFADQFRRTLATRETYETMYQRAWQRQQDLDRDIAALNGPSNDPRLDYQRQQLQSSSERNRKVLAATQKRLEPIYRQLETDRGRIDNVQDFNTRQELGSLLSGTLEASQIVPVWTRLTAADAGGMIRYGAQSAALPVVRGAEGALNNVAANAGTRAGNAEAALLNQNSITWTPRADQATGRYQLVAHDAATGQPVSGIPPRDTRIPTTQVSANGSTVPHENGATAARDLGRLFDARSQAAQEVQRLRFQASRSINQRQQQAFESLAQKAEARKVELEGSIAKYQAENPAIGARFKALGIDAAKWGAASVGITLGANVVSELHRNNWDPGKINWRNATGFLTDLSFWGGTGGSFLGAMGGSMLASALPAAFLGGPWGPVAKVALSIGGGAVGFQLGSGNARNTDWLGLGVSTAGSTAGFMLGRLIPGIGPLGGIAGAIAGQLVADWLYKKVKALLQGDPDAESYSQDPDLVARPPVQALPPTKPYGANPYDPYTVAPDAPVQSSADQILEMTEQVRQLYVEMVQAERSGDMELAQTKRREFEDTKERLDLMRRGMQEQMGNTVGDFRNSR